MFINQSAVRQAVWQTPLDCFRDHLSQTVDTLGVIPEEGGELVRLEGKAQHLLKQIEHASQLLQSAKDNLEAREQALAEGAFEAPMELDTHEQAFGLTSADIDAMPDDENQEEALVLLAEQRVSHLRAELQVVLDQQSAYMDLN